MIKTGQIAEGITPHVLDDEVPVIKTGRANKCGCNCKCKADQVAALANDAVQRLANSISGNKNG